MKRSSFPAVVTLLLLTVTMASCEVIGDIFKAGMGFGIFLVVLVIVGVVVLMRKIGGGK